MKNLTFLLYLSILLVFIGCSGNDESKFVFGKGKYKFTMTDSTGKKIADGDLFVTEYKINDISGTYEFRNVYQKDFNGLSTMDGKFAGNVVPEKKIVFINTNPRIADSNVFWNLNIKNNYMTGEWNYSVFRGAISKGKIKITK